MCLAVPTQVVEILENTMCRVAMHKLDPEEAEKSLAALRELAAAMEKNGDMAVLEAEQRQD